LQFEEYKKERFLGGGLSMGIFGIEGNRKITD
jgi:hypothetical protein